MSYPPGTTFRYTSPSGQKFIAVTYNNSILQVFSTLTGTTKSTHSTLEEWVQSISSAINISLTINDIDTTVKNGAIIKQLNSVYSQYKFPTNGKFRSVMNWLYNIVNEFAPSMLENTSLINAFNTITQTIDESTEFRPQYWSRYRYALVSYNERIKFGGFPLGQKYYYYGNEKKIDNELVNKQMDIIKTNWKLITDLIIPICGEKIKRVAKLTELKHKLVGLRRREKNMSQKLYDIHRYIESTNDEIVTLALTA